MADPVDQDVPAAAEPTEAQEAPRSLLDEAMDVLEEFLEETLTVLDVGEDCTVDLSLRGEGIHAELDGDRDDVALLIGKRGQTLDAVQYLANAIIASQCESPVPVQVDAQGYRARRAVQLQESADRAVAEVLRSGRKVELEPMTASERKVVHHHLAESDEVETYSTGREPERRLVVAPRSDA